MTAQVFTVTRVAHATVVRGCCGNTDEVCNCQPTECVCTPPEGDTHG